MVYSAQALPLCCEFPPEFRRRALKRETKNCKTSFNQKTHQLTVKCATCAWHKSLVATTAKPHIIYISLGHMNSPHPAVVSEYLYNLFIDWCGKKCCVVLCRVVLCCVCVTLHCRYSNVLYCMVWFGPVWSSLFVCLLACLFVCLFVCLLVCFFLSLFLCLFACSCLHNQSYH